MTRETNFDSRANKDGPKARYDWKNEKFLTEMGG